MRRIDYLKLCIKERLYGKFAWLVSAFSITREAEEAWKDKPYFLRIVRQPWGISFVNQAGELEAIDDAVKDQPLFQFKERVTIDNSWLVNVQQPTETCIGNIIYNALVLVEPFQERIPFVTGVISQANVEKTLAAKLRDVPKPGEQRDRNYVYCDELILSNDNLQLITELTQLATVAATPRNIVKPKGIDEYRAKLIAEYGDKLSNPVYIAEYEGKLRQYAKEYMKGDPSDGIFFSGKVADTAYKKMYLTVGGIAGFGDGMKVTPIAESLDDGWPTDPEKFAAMMNDSRVGSYLRGAETVNGGVAAKVLLRAANNFSIKDTDCQTKLGRRLYVTRTTLKGIIQRTIIVNGKLIKIEDAKAAEAYIGQHVVVRSPQGCKMAGDTLCKVCAGDKLMTNPNGLGIPLTEESGLILLASLKAMHGTVLSTIELDLDEVFQ